MMNKTTRWDGLNVEFKGALLIVVISDKKKMCFWDQWMFKVYKMNRNYKH